MGLAALILMQSCDSSKSNKISNYSAVLNELNPFEYPDNPDTEIKHPKYDQIKYGYLNFISLNDTMFSIKIIPDGNTDTIFISSVNLMEYIPTITCAAKKNLYLSYIDVINQEWNRNQVQFKEGEYKISGSNNNHIVRLDIARNCLNAYLWEVILFADYKGEVKPYYHGWFDFPKELYATLFEIRNKVKFSEYQKPLENWVDPENKKFDPTPLRTILSEQDVKFINLNNTSYPLKGERQKKFKNIIYPVNTTIIQNYLTDSTLFATFSPPGIYNKSDPRKTELSKLDKLGKIIWRKTNAPYFSNDTLIELELLFNIGDKKKETHFFISGILPSEIPALDSSEVNNGWQNSMGIGNHTFYETYKHAQEHSSLISPYFSVLTDKDGNWIDSHKIGIDGPLLYWDNKHKNMLHVWIFSFERHAFVGHYIVTLK